MVLKHIQIKRASRLARAILVMVAKLLAMPPTDSSFTLALRVRITLFHYLYLFQNLTGGFSTLVVLKENLELETNLWGRYLLFVI